MIPTTQLTYGEKKTLAPFRNFQAFLFGIGESVQVATLGKTVAKLFTDPSKLVGQKLNVDLGYEGAHVARAADGTFNIIERGQALQEDGETVGLPDRASAIQYAKAKGIEPSFLRVVKFTAKKPAAVKKAPVASDW